MVKRGLEIERKFERCHTCIYYQEYGYCTVRELEDRYNEWCQDYIRKEELDDSANEG